MTPPPGPDEHVPTAGLGRFVALASDPVARRLGPPSAVARLPLGMTTLALLLLVQRDSGSFVVAGAVTASFALASGVTSPVRGRLVDRFGPVPVALVSVVASSTWAASQTGALVSAGAAGALLPPVGPVVRVLWQGLPSSGLRDAAFAADSILLQVIYYGAGPPLVTFLTVVWSPQSAVFAVAGLTLVGTALVASAPTCRAWRIAPESPPLLGALLIRGVPGILVVVVVSSAALGSVEVAVAGFAAENGIAGLAGLFLAALGAGSVAGGLWFGSRSSRGALRVQYRFWLAATAVGLVPLPFCRNPVWMAAFLIIAGFSVAPPSIVQFRLVGGLAPADVITESFTWLLSAVLAGTAIGNVVAGGLVDVAGSSVALGSAVLTATAAAVLSLFGGGRPRRLDAR